MNTDVLQYSPAPVWSDVTQLYVPSKATNSKCIFTMSYSLTPVLESTCPVWIEKKVRIKMGEKVEMIDKTDIRQGKRGQKEKRMRKEEE